MFVISPRLTRQADVGETRLRDANWGQAGGRLGRKAIDGRIVIYPGVHIRRADMFLVGPRLIDNHLHLPGGQPYRPENGHFAGLLRGA